jgi:organic radical activating enzyme
MILRKVIDEIKQENIFLKSVDLLGGEPILIFDEILKITKSLKEKNINFTFPTNASLLDFEKIDLLLEA